jgi:hypothetical protein
MVTSFYNLAGTYTSSKRRFAKYLKEEIKFYRKLAEQNPTKIKRFNPEKIGKLELSLYY